MKTTFIKENYDELLLFVENKHSQLNDFIAKLKTAMVRNNIVYNLSCDGDSIAYLASSSSLKHAQFSFDDVFSLVNNYSKEIGKTISKEKTSLEELEIGKEYRRVQICAAANNFNSGSGMFFSNNSDSPIQYLICFENTIHNNPYSFNIASDSYSYECQRIKQKDGTYKVNQRFLEWVKESMKDNTKKILVFVESESHIFRYEGIFKCVDINNRIYQNSDHTILTLQGQTQNIVNKIVEDNKKQIEKERKINNSLSLEKLKAKAEKISEANQKTAIKNKQVISKQYERNQAINDYVIRAANGVCKMCGKKVGKDLINEVPELQCHHIKPLSDGGTDTIDNCVALCPNCHRHVHKYKLKKE